MEHSHGGHGADTNMTGPSSIVIPPSYFGHPEYSGLMLAHIAVMSLDWIFILPIGVMLSIARSRLAIPANYIFLIANAIGLGLAAIYNSLTPDLYENNAHHRLGWIVTFIVTAQAILGIIRTYGHKREEVYVMPTAQYRQVQDFHTTDQHRYSRDSGQGTEPPTPRTSSPYSPCEESHDDTPRMTHVRTFSEESLEDEKRGLLGNTAADRLLHRMVARIANTRAMPVMRIVYEIIERTILLLGFATICTGLVTYGGIFRGAQVFSGLAHFIKGGIFFWLGLLALGRCMGSFGDLGWAWNLKPPASVVGPRKAAAPSAEFVESFLIFFYGATNVFLEHLGGWGGEWSATDLEHISITIMFFGGGLCGMLVESKRIREILNSAVVTSSNYREFRSPPELWQEPRTYGFSMNPLPAIIIMLLGVMMSSHHQSSMTSTMMHKQWGGLFAIAACARGISYILTYLSPPTTFFPSRPPSEIVAAFCLVSGGLIFMASNSDVVDRMERYDLNAMFTFTVVMGLSAFLMAWTIVLLAIKGWAVRREQRKSFASSETA